MNFAALYNQEWQYLDNTEAVTLFRKTSDQGFDAGVVVPNALRIVDAKEGPVEPTGSLFKAKLDWYLWSVQTSDGAGNNPPVKNGDVIQDAGGTRWDVWFTDIQAYGARFYCKTVQEH